MQYTVTTKSLSGPDDVKIYEGFQSFNGMNSPKAIAVVIFDGETDLFEIDPTKPATVTSEIIRYYRDGYDRGPERLDFYSLGLSSEMSFLSSIAGRRI